jgi:peptidoglycan/xylan/chitin deacetylase (PgdA/CDA1 family)
MYHHVEPLPLDPPPVYAASYIARDAFARQLDRMRSWGLETLTFAEACAAAARGESPRRRVVLTFDDACDCFARHAAPELQARGMTATLFAVSGRLGGTNDWDAPAGERRERLLEASELGALAAQGFEIASHGRHHADLEKLDDRAQQEELAGSRRDLEAALGTSIATFCYPYGHLNGRTREHARSAGYLGAASIHGQPLANPHDPFALARMIVGPRESAFELWLKARGAYPAWSRLPRLGLLRAFAGRRQ